MAILTLFGILTFLHPKAREWPSINLEKIIIYTLSFDLALFIYEKLTRIDSYLAVPLWATLIVNPIQEEIIFRQPLFFLRETKYYWPIGIVVGTVFVLLHQNTGMYELIGRSLGTLLLLYFFKKYGLIGSILTHSLLNLGNVFRSLS